MRVMVFVKSDERVEAGALPDERILTEVGRFNQTLVNAGVILAGDGLTPSSNGVRIEWSTGRPTVIVGPFAEPKELVAGYWLWQVRSLDEAIEWVKRAPFGPGAVLELRPVVELDDLGAGLTPELRDQQERLRATVATRGA